MNMELGCKHCIALQAVSPFIDPVTSQKIQFCKGKDEKAIMSRYFDMNKMETCLGGQSNKEFDFATYEQQQLAYEKQILETTIKDSHVGVNGIHAQVWAHVTCRGCTEEWSSLSASVQCESCHCYLMTGI